MTVIALDFNPNNGKNRNHKRTCCHGKSDCRTSSVCDILPCKKRFRILNRRGQCCSSKFPTWDGYNQESGNISNNNGDSNAAEEQFCGSSGRCVNSFFLNFFFLSYGILPSCSCVCLYIFNIGKNVILIFAKKSETIFFGTIRP